jgi:hypothetical protein
MATVRVRAPEAWAIRVLEAKAVVAEEECELSRWALSR